MARLPNGKRALTDFQIMQKHKEQAMQEEANRLVQEKVNSKKRYDLDPITEDARMNLKKIEKFNETTRLKYNEFRKSIKGALVEECVYSIYRHTLPIVFTESMSSSGMDVDSITRGFVHDFIEENGGTDAILKNWSHKNMLLSEYASIINKTYDKILESVDKTTPETYGMPSNIKNQFYDQISLATPEDVVATVKERITSSIETFMGENKAMKAAITDICNNAQAKAATTDDEELREAYDMRAKRQIADYKNTHKTSILGEMVKLNAKNIMYDDNLRNQFMENGRLNMDIVVESSILMYGLIETANTLNMVDINSDWIQSMLESASKKGKKKVKSRDHIESSYGSKKDKEEDRDDKPKKSAREKHLEWKAKKDKENSEKYPSSDKRDTTLDSDIEVD